MTTQCLVFDFDGTMIDTEEPLYLSWAELWAEHGHELDRAFWQTLIGTDDSFDAWRELESLVGRPLDLAHQEARRRRRDALIAERGVQPGVLEWLAKPDPSSYRHACEQLGGRSAVSVAVEDSPHGVAAARAASMYVVAVPCRLTADLDLSAADVVIDSLVELSLADALEAARAR